MNFWFIVEKFNYFFNNLAPSTIYFLFTVWLKQPCYVSAAIVSKHNIIQHVHFAIYEMVKLSTAEFTDPID